MGTVSGVGMGGWSTIVLAAVVLTACVAVPIYQDEDASLQELIQEEVTPSSLAKQGREVKRDEKKLAKAEEKAAKEKAKAEKKIKMDKEKEEKLEKQVEGKKEEEEKKKEKADSEKEQVKET